MHEKIYIEDLSKLEVTKVKPWAIYFKYDDQGYMLHQNDGDCVYSFALYKRNILENGRYELEHMVNRYGDLEVYRYISNYGKGAYKHINKSVFVKKLLVDGFSEGLFEEEYKETVAKKEGISRAIKVLEAEMRKIEEEYWYGKEVSTEDIVGKYFKEVGV